MLRLKILTVAEERGVSFSQLCREALEEKFGQNGQNGRESKKSPRAGRVGPEQPIIGSGL
jgi:hypothetical protein